MRILALDLGEKNIGVALSDELGWTAQGLPSLKVSTKEQVIQEIKNLIKRNQVNEIVVGMPVNMDGSLGRKAKEAADFVQELHKDTGLAVKLWDERLSSMQAEKVMLEADLSRKKRKKKIDQLSAQLILQNYLDAKNATQDVHKDCTQ